MRRLAFPETLQGLGGEPGRFRVVALGRFPQLLHATERATSLSLCCVGTQTARAEALLEQPQVQLDLVVQRVIVAPASEQRGAFRDQH